MVRVARMPMTTMMTNNSTIVKPDLTKLVLRSPGEVGSSTMVKADEIPERSRRGETTLTLRSILRSFSEVESLWRSRMKALVFLFIVIFIVADDNCCY